MTGAQLVFLDLISDVIHNVLECSEAKAKNATNDIVIIVEYQVDTLTHLISIFQFMLLISDMYTILGILSITFHEFQSTATAILQNVMRFTF